MLTERGANIPSARLPGHAGAQASSSKSTSPARPSTKPIKRTRSKLQSGPSALVTIPEDTVVALPAAQSSKRGRTVVWSARAAVVTPPSLETPTLDDEPRADIMKAVDFLGLMEVGPGDEAYEPVRLFDSLRRVRLQGWRSPR